jgi:hypothetical protein
MFDCYKHNIVHHFEHLIKTKGFIISDCVEDTNYIKYVQIKKEKIRIK